MGDTSSGISNAWSRMDVQFADNHTNIFANQTPSLLSLDLKYVLASLFQAFNIVIYPRLINQTLSAGVVYVAIKVCWYSASINSFVVVSSVGAQATTVPVEYTCISQLKLWSLSLKPLNVLSRNHETVIEVCPLKKVCSHWSSQFSSSQHIIIWPVSVATELDINNCVPVSIYTYGVPWLRNNTGVSAVSTSGALQNFCIKE